MSAISKVLIQGTLTKAKKALILLHGRGGTAEDILSLAETLIDDDFYVAAPQATNNIWYPQSFMSEDRLNEPYLTSSVNEIKELIDHIAQHIPKNQIYIAGFSQGACMSLEVSARFAEKYGGIVAFTGGLIGKSIREEKYHGDFQGTNVFISNGDEDPFIPLARSQESGKLLEKLNANVTMKVYEGRPHIVTDDELHYVKTHIL